MDKVLRRRGRKIFPLLIGLILAAALAGCGNADADGSTDTSEEERAQRQESREEERKKPENGTDEEKDRQDDTEEASPEPEEKAPEFTYLESMMIEDYYGDMAEYEVYVPKGSSYENGQVFYSGHGLTYSAYVSDYGQGASMEEWLDFVMRLETDSWEEQPAEYMDVTVGEIVESGEDFWQAASAKRKDVFDIPFDWKRLCYMDMKKEGLCVQWHLELSEVSTDEETDLIIDELAQCYSFDPEEIRSDGGWAVANEERIRAEKAKDSLPETVLWFNATYAPLTQSNKSFGTNWKLVGGMKVSDYNADFCRQSLERDWEITDAVSAMETVESLKEKGHREKFRQCREELADRGILEVDEETFVDAINELIEADEIEGNPFRYVIVYLLHQDGLDADCIAAWDLCRVNQLYADFYISGYMTYEEAMDASLENSLILQAMYPSWEDMVNSYLLGYQFWQGDPAMTEDSPTQKRYQCYLELLQMEDGPYTLDWNMDLVKSW